MQFDAPPNEHTPQIMQTNASEEVREPLNTTPRPIMHWQTNAYMYTSSAEDRSRLADAVPQIISVIHRERLYEDNRLLPHNRLSDDELRGLYNAGVTLLTAIWPFGASRTPVERARREETYILQVSVLQYTLKAKGLEILNPDVIRLSALFCEVAWYTIFNSKGDNLALGQESALFSLQVLDRVADSDRDNLWSQLRRDSYRYRAIIETLMGDGHAAGACWDWIKWLEERIEKYAEQEDINMRPIACNEYGIALMRVFGEARAMEAWESSCGMVERDTKMGELPFPLPWMNKALVLAYSGKHHEALVIALPFLKQREEKLGRDDVSTIDTGLLLNCIGNIYRMQGCRGDAYAFFERAVAVEKATIGEWCLWTIASYYRLACEQFERGEFAPARDLLEKCVRFAGEKQWYKGVAARACWKLGRTLQALGGDENLKQAG
ncbi:hypothetical protein QBC34DRAFT_410189 [Podospora aff. communis PSN243]|uniref:Uncharacterized protein n=1 Tax=Podospora aff. communis PSN243 TaxID=3040156 RepID=A0AAV9GEN0_9PEZI|nr:hypothetical protein QBC34DRAFT_410189 [Podospora aff. communis PSN243]